MKLEIYSGMNPAQISWNFEALKKTILEGLEKYKGRIYLPSEIVHAKKDVAELRAFRQELNRARIDTKNRYMEPYEKFASQVKELTALLDGSISEISAQINASEEARKADKLEKVKALYDETFGDLARLVPFEKVQNDRWLNVTYDLCKVKADLEVKAKDIRTGLDTISMLNVSDSARNSILSVFLDSLDLTTALAEKARLEAQEQRMKEYRQATEKPVQSPAGPSQTIVRESEKEEQPQTRGAQAAMAPTEHATENLLTIDLRLYLRRDQLDVLKAFLRNNGIRYGKVPQKHF